MAPFNGGAPGSRDKFYENLGVLYGRRGAVGGNQRAMEQKGAGRAVAEATEAPLRLERAFVVQLREQPDPAANLFVGRAEHLVSGASERFTCAADLLAFITKVLAPPGGPR